MGIKNLLQFVDKACTKGHISEFEGKTIAVDVSCLLHRSFMGCAYDVAHGNRSNVYINYIKRYVHLLLHYKCHVILVFDGQPLPAKKDTNEKRKAARQHNLHLGRLSLQNGDTAQATKHFQSCTSITTDVVEHTISVFREMDNVDILVAPYEADAQLTFLVKRGIAYAVVTEDSDLIPFGCSKVILKLNQEGECTIYNRDLLYKCVARPLWKKFNICLFRRLCILSGCDYFEGIPKVGLKKAHEAFLRTSNATDFAQTEKFLKKLPYTLSLNKITITNNMIKSFIQAELTFLHQIVYDPLNRVQKPLYEYPNQMAPEIKKFLSHNNDDMFWFAGTIRPAQEAFRLAIGNVDLLAEEDKFTLNCPPNWSIYHADKVYDLPATETNFEATNLTDSGYSSYDSQNTGSQGSFNTSVVETSIVSMASEVEITVLSTPVASRNGNIVPETPLKKIGSFSHDANVISSPQGFLGKNVGNDNLMCVPETPLKPNTADVASTTSENCMPDPPLKIEASDVVQINNDNCVPETPEKKWNTTKSVCENIKQSVSKSKESSEVSIIAVTKNSSNRQHIENGRATIGTSASKPVLRLSPNLLIRRSLSSTTSKRPNVLVENIQSSSPKIQSKEVLRRRPWPDQRLSFPKPSLSIPVNSPRAMKRPLSENSSTVSDTLAIKRLSSSFTSSFMPTSSLTSRPSVKTSASILPKKHI